jgi:hypothetical protein
MIVYGIATSGCSVLCSALPKQREKEGDCGSLGGVESVADGV